MISGKTCAYSGWTAVVGVAWYCFFLILPGGWKLVTQPHMLLASRSALIPFATFLIVSMVVGVTFRSWITSARVGRAVLLGCALPFLGGALYAFTWYALMRWVDGPDSSSTNAGPGSLWLELPVMGAFFALYYAYGTIPMGILSVFTLRWVDRRITRADVVGRTSPD
jgi:hypothetical protein